MRQIPLVVFLSSPAAFTKGGGANEVVKGKLDDKCFKLKVLVLRTSLKPIDLS
jgi:hypothetical protein